MIFQAIILHLLIHIKSALKAGKKSIVKFLLHIQKADSIFTCIQQLHYSIEEFRKPPGNIIQITFPNNPFY
jgi:hypothetical protein